MKKLFKLSFFIPATIFVLVACEKINSNGNNPGGVVATGEYTNLTQNSVCLYGWCNQKEEEGLSVIFGVQYSDRDLTSGAFYERAEIKGQDNKYYCILSGLLPNTKYYYRAYIYYSNSTTFGEVKTFTTPKLSYQIPEPVDLGLSVKWASFNVGATMPEEYGGYFQWAGTEDIRNTSFERDYNNCPYHTGLDSGSGWTKYTTARSYCANPDNKAVLDPSDDVAHVKLGDNWWMPTREEFQELLDNCTFEWTTMNGVNGQKFISKKNGNNIFLPVASYYHDVLNAYYWSSSLDVDWPYDAYNLVFREPTGGFGSKAYCCTAARYEGRPVRPVLRGKNRD